MVVVLGKLACLFTNQSGLGQVEGRDVEGGTVGVGEAEPLWR